MKKTRILLPLCILVLNAFTLSTTVYANDFLLHDAQFNCYTPGDSDTGKDSGGDNGSELDSEVEKNIKDIYTYAHDIYGLSGQAIAGILANWKIESGIIPHAVEGDFTMPGGRSIETAKANTNGLMGIGYGQWTAGRHTALVNWSKKDFKGEWWTTKAQLDFMFKGDGGFVAILKSYALTSSDDVMNNTILFHNTWEISADSPEKVIAQRGGAAKEIWEFMKKEGMDGKKDESKINKIEGDANAGGNDSSSSAGGTIEDVCGSDGSGVTGGKLGQSTKVNGKHGNITKMMSYDDALKEYGSTITLPKFDYKSYDWGSTPFQVTGGIDLRGQCTELTWAMMSFLYDGKQPTIGNGGEVWKSYKDAGAKITKNPTVGYGFSASGGYLGAVSGGEYGDAGHTGVVLAVFDDGSFLAANFNIPPHAAPERYITVTLIDGVDGSDGVTFFSGVGKPKIDSENK